MDKSFWRGTALPGHTMIWLVGKPMIPADAPVGSADTLSMTVNGVASPKIGIAVQ